MVPFVFAFDGETIHWAVDDKPKRSRRLARLDNIAADPRVEALVDGYDDERWANLWWVRASGRASLVTDADEQGRALGLLSAKYAQYRGNPPAGPVVAIRVERMTWWPAGPDPAAGGSG